MLKTLVPVVVAIVSAIVSIYGAVITTQEKNEESFRAFDAGFVKLLNDNVLRNTKVLTKKADFDDEQRAAFYLFALDGLASTVSEHRTVLLVANRLLNASTARYDSGYPAARFLDVAIGEIDDELKAGQDVDKNKELLTLIHSPEFLDLAASGYAQQYYKDLTDPGHADFQPTLLGDERILYPAKEELLWEIGQRPVNGWIHVASWRTHYAFNIPASGQPPRWTKDVDAGRTSEYYPFPMYDYLSKGNLRDLLAGQVVGARLLGSRLLRDRPPSVYVSNDGSIREGILGRITGDVPISACVDLLEPARPVLVFVESQRLHRRKTAFAWEGVAHLWAHVGLSKGCADGEPSSIADESAP